MMVVRLQAFDDNRLPTVTGNGTHPRPMCLTFTSLYCLYYMNGGKSQITDRTMVMTATSKHT